MPIMWRMPFAIGLPGRRKMPDRGQLCRDGSMARAVKNPLPLRASDATGSALQPPARHEGTVSCAAARKVSLGRPT